MFKHISNRQRHPIHPFLLSTPLNVKKGFIKGEALRLLRTNSDRETFEAHIKDFQLRLIERGYPENIVFNTLSTVKFEAKQLALEIETRTSRNPVSSKFQVGFWMKM